MDNFKKNHNLVKDRFLLLQEISSYNTVTHNGKMYELQGETYNSFTSDATYMHNGIPGVLPVTNIVQKEDKKEILTITKDSDGEIDTILIVNTISGEAVELASIVPGVLATIEHKDYDIDDLQRRFHYYPEKKSLDVVMTAKDKPREANDNPQCIVFREIDLAVVYESSFCESHGGSTSNANKQVVSLVAMVSSRYRQIGLCVKIKLSHLEGYCDPSDLASDPTPSPTLYPTSIIPNGQDPSCRITNLRQRVFNLSRSIGIFFTEYLP